jgi:membrane protein DedA with SNARE-associated domain
MLNIFEIAIDLAVEWFSWRLWLCILLAIGIIVGAYFKFPEHDGFWPLTSPLGVIIIVFGVWWHWRSER